MFHNGCTEDVTSRNINNFEFDHCYIEVDLRHHVFESTFRNIGNCANRCIGKQAFLVFFDMQIAQCDSQNKTPFIGKVHYGEFTVQFAHEGITHRIADQRHIFWFEAFVLRIFGHKELHGVDEYPSTISDTVGIARCNIPMIGADTLRRCAQFAVVS